ncbi:MAG: hypothetical protein Q8842_03390, partial [Candidatus Phytoplasma australasiaticum]|nr:hypothetical protein [Candidatus Phytoplasma australasiaticum]
TLTAFNKIAANRGAGTPGINNKTIDGINLILFGLKIIESIWVLPIGGTERGTLLIQMTRLSWGWLC